MPDEAPRIYWDACVLLSYINGIADRLPVIEELLRQSTAGEVVLITSVLSQTEVAFAAFEKQQGTLDHEVEEQIAAVWAPGSPVTAVEFYELIADRARGLMRQAISQGWGSLKPADAIHLATAQQIGVSDFHTYDGGLQAWDGRLGFLFGSLKPRRDSWARSEFQWRRSRDTARAQRGRAACGTLKRPRISEATRGQLPSSLESSSCSLSL